MRWLLLSLPLVLGFGVQGAFAATEIKPETRQALWCVTAFERVEPAIREQDEKAADQFVTYTVSLRRQLIEAFRAEGLTQADVDTLQEETILQVASELGEGGKPAHSFETCQALGLDAFNAMQSAPAAPAETPAEPPAAGAN